jgi:hypothetical protein
MHGRKGSGSSKNALEMAHKKAADVCGGFIRRLDS